MSAQKRLVNARSDYSSFQRNVYVCVFVCSAHVCGVIVYVQEKEAL